MATQSSIPSAAQLLERVDAFESRPVLIVADLVADRFITGSPKRISREAPVLILRYEGETLSPGGGANAVANLAALGGRPLLVGLVGDDPQGRELVDDLEQRGVDTQGILVKERYRTPTKTRILGGAKHSIKQQIVRFDIEDPLELSAVEAAEIRSRIERHAGTVEVAVLSDYGYGAVEPGILSSVRRSVGDDGLVLCDSRYRLGDFSGADGATPNEEETEAITGPLDDALLEGSGEALLSRLGLRFLLVTRGSHGMALVEPHSTTHLPVHGTDQVADVTGAGDTVIGTFALALASGASRIEAALLANYAGGIVVMKMGTATLSPEELRNAIRSDPQPLERLRWVAT